MPRQCIPAPGAGFLCVTRGRRPKPKQCSVCGLWTAGLLCDGPAPAGAKRKTCDAALCTTCAVQADFDIHYCPAHRVPGPKQQELEL